MLKKDPPPNLRIPTQYIVYVGDKSDKIVVQLEAASFSCICYNDPFMAYVSCLSNVYDQQAEPYAVICREDLHGTLAYSFISNIKRCPQLKAIPSILYNPKTLQSDIRKAKNAGADDLYTGVFELQDLLSRLEFIRQTKEQALQQKFKPSTELRLGIPVGKRIFDIFFSLLALLILSPLLLVIALIIRLESNGPVFYISKRVGTGYRIFDFYKFRSMRSDADKMLQELIHLNQYNSEGGQANTFFKFDKDPRVTPFGRFLRHTSLDELPQLINVLLGDMSIVGNRPLPLYEARQITKDLWSKRFLAPAGITGLWQVSRRGRKDMSAEERIALDMTYADRCSLWFDLKIVMQTFPALLQKESV